MYQYDRKKDESALRNVFLTIAIISLIIFLIVAYMGYNDWPEITKLDNQIGSVFHNLRTQSRTSIAIAITRIANFSGQVVLATVITFALILFKKWRTGLWFGLMALLGAGVINGVVKSIFHRARPTDIEHLIEQGGYAFPSGHSMGSMIIFGSLLFILYRYINSRKSYWPVGKVLLSLTLGLLILMIGLSRIYLGVHFPTDVIGGFALGLSWISFNFAFIGLTITKKDFNTRRRYHFKSL
ncbi:MAG TPA: phosphatase PAP2 family protein [Atopostipes sp.]|nr:phosphatase PAP2 family protein [Atopostipes sp.]